MKVELSESLKPHRLHLEESKDRFKKEVVKIIRHNGALDRIQLIKRNVS